MSAASRVLAAAALVALAAAFARGAAAEEQLELHPGNDLHRTVGVRVRWGLPGGIATNGWGWVRVDVANRDASAQTVSLTVNVGGTHSIQRSLTVAAGGSAVAWLPRLSGGGSDFLWASLPSGSQSQSYDYGGNEPIRVLLLGDAGRWKGVTDAIGTRATPKSSGGGSWTRVTATTAEEIPDRWTCLTSASWVVVDAGAAGLDANQPQRSIAGYLAGGGAVLILRPASLPPGPLKDVLAAAGEGTGSGGGSGRCGLGRWWSLADPAHDTARLDEALKEWDELSHVPVDPVAGSGFRVVRGLTPKAFDEPLEIPGLGEAPVRLFFFLILGFAILVGPVAYLTLRRRRRLTRMLWIVPSAGLGFAGAILLYGLVSEGLGTKGSVRTLTVLDQRSHEAFGAGHRTLYAGLAPAALEVSPDTLVTSLQFQPDTAWVSRMQRSIRFDLDAGTRIRGDALPSRSPTTYATATVTRARDRIRFKRRPDGLYEVLSSDGFEPLDAPGSLVLHAPDGSWHVFEGRVKPLRPQTPEAAIAAAKALGDDFAQAPLAPWPEDDEGARYRAYGMRTYLVGDRPWESGAETHRFADAATGTIPPGAYLGRMSSAPGFDDFGLDVRWLVERHVVLGLLAPEDVDG